MKARSTHIKKQQASWYSKSQAASVEDVGKEDSGYLSTALTAAAVPVIALASWGLTKVFPSGQEPVQDQEPEPQGGSSLVSGLLTAGAVAATAVVADQIVGHFRKDKKTVLGSLLEKVRGSDNEDGKENKENNGGENEHQKEMVIERETKKEKEVNTKKGQLLGARSVQETPRSG